ncbi:hypothetical protein EDD16DRAFT_1517366 [Pisolithus croceorrhizus]|nr:hypothetical protein EDD16DRAFT_1517366 [Pisolithus croceorrhizus]KAI6130051.1 hypothetical protein EV401DRAFT_1884498 [Pisolithus croceorrhizus]
MISALLADDQALHTHTYIQTLTPYCCSITQGHMDHTDEGSTHTHKCMYRTNRDTPEQAPGILVPKSDTTVSIQVIGSALPAKTQDTTSEAKPKPANSPVISAAADTGITSTEEDQTRSNLKSGTQNVEEGHWDVHGDPNEPSINCDWLLMPPNKPEKCSVLLEALASKYSAKRGTYQSS